MLERINGKLVKAFQDLIVKQMRAAVTYDLHSRLIRNFPNCYYSLQQLRVSHPSFNGENLYFCMNFDTFAGQREPRHSEAGFRLCLATLRELESSSIGFKQMMKEFIERMK